MTTTEPNDTIIPARHVFEAIREHLRLEIVTVWEPSALKGWGERKMVIRAKWAGVEFDLNGEGKDTTGRVK